MCGLRYDCIMLFYPRGLLINNRDPTSKWGAFHKLKESGGVLYGMIHELQHENTAHHTQQEIQTSVNKNGKENM